MRIKYLIVMLAMSVSLYSCSAHHPFIVKTNTDVAGVSKNKYTAHTSKVFVTRLSMPGTMKYEVLGTIEVAKTKYGSIDDALQPLADEARQMGADAVIEVKTWMQPSGWAWAAPHGSGIAVKIISPSRPDYGGIEGEMK